MPDTTKISRYFLSAPVLQSAAEEIVRNLGAAVQRHPDSLPADQQARNQRPLLVVPSARAARALSAHLGRHASRVRTCTPGEICEELLDSASATSPEVLTRVWEVALAELHAAGQSSPLASSAARPLAALRDELSAAGFDTESLLARFGPEIPATAYEHLSAIARLEQRYEQLLSEAGLVDRWMSRRAAWEARAWRKQADGPSAVWLIACAELAPFAQMVLREYAGVTQTHVLVAARPEHAHAFNEWGVLVTPAADQARAAMAVAQLGSEWDAGQFRYERVATLWKATELIADGVRARGDQAHTAIGVINRADRHVLAAALAQREISARDGHGVSFTSTATVRFLSALLSYLGTRCADDLLAFLNTAAQVSTLEGAREAANELDLFIAREAPYTVLHQPSPGMSLVLPWIEALAGLRSGECSPSQFLARCDGALLALDDAGLECREKLGEILSLMCRVPHTDGLEALRATLAALQRANHEPRGDAPTTELFGWLELFLDESAVVEVVNPSSELVPGPQTGNPFLPESLRRVIGLPTQASRAARDRYRWWYITNSGRDVRVLLQASGARGEPLLLTPCFVPVSDLQRAATLLLTRGVADDSARAASSATVSSVVEPSGASSSGTSSSGTGSDQQGRALLPLTVIAPESVSVSGVGDYLVCPYRFALRHMLKLSAIEDVTHEFNALRFGEILHSVLDSVVSAEIAGRVFENEKQLSAAMQLRLERELQCVETRQGGALIQAQSMRSRLDAYAEWHLDFRRAGWRPVASELPFTLLAPSGLSVKGRIDRAERNEQTGETFLLDIKTAENESNVEVFHRPAFAGGTWTSLQLPLYRLGWKMRPQPQDWAREQLRLGLLFIDGAASISLQESKWTEQDLDDAYAQFVSATNGIHAGVFWPPSSAVKYDSFPFLNLFALPAALASRALPAGESDS